MRENPHFALRVEARMLQKEAGKQGRLDPKIIDHVSKMRSEDTVNFLLNQFPK